MKLGWDATSQTLTITATAWASAISRTDTGADGAQASIVLVRTPTPKLTNKCISVSAPAPSTKLDGITTVSGKAQLFEAGPVPRSSPTGRPARAPRVHPGEDLGVERPRAVLQGRQPAAARCAEEGHLSAFEPSARDGAPTCEVNVPDDMSPGG